MVEAYEQTGGNMVAAMEVAPEKASSYGVLDIAEDLGSIVTVKGMVEKPKAADAPSNLAVIGRYILSPQVMQNLNHAKHGAGGEIQLTDAIAEECQSPGKVFGFRFRGQRYDCGSKAGFLQATVAFGLSRPDLRDEFAAYLNDMVALQKAAQ
jgi:UTP--glucose-1-phosphate uridylyltransferase